MWFCAGITNRMEMLSTIDLLIKVTDLVKEVNDILI